MTNNNNNDENNENINKNIGSHPVKVKQTNIIINEVTTDIVISYFTDKIFVVISQNKKLGTMVEAKTERAISGKETSFNINVILGKREDMRVNLTARRLIEKLSVLNGSNDSPANSVSLLLAIALLKQTTLGDLKPIIATVEELLES
eukprot:TRINITY_DN865_c1_g1_i2.p1 TRINITY_DN865_c1_g1~~TRINITY_DN865_c1_g1_i2.p1  ORF type:complete len:147 (-),score=35.21 TRINITY_DN865_c1_g1_i2:172-612(-)